jgi:CheY-like chemotaxis protein
MNDAVAKLRAAGSRGVFPDVVIVRDLREGGSLDLSRMIRGSAQLKNPQVPILLVTNDPFGPSEAEALDAGVTSYLFGPLRPQLLIDRMRAALAAASADIRDDPAIDVMIVDDDSSNRGIVKLFLKNLPARSILEAADGEAALESLKLASHGDRLPHILIVDYVMEPMDGLTLVRKIRQSKDISNRNIPILMLTFRADRETVRAAQLAGANGFIAKPVNSATLVGRINRALTASSPRAPPPAAGAAQRPATWTVGGAPISAPPGNMATNRGLRPLSEIDIEAVKSVRLREVLKHWRGMRMDSGLPPISQFQSFMGSAIQTADMTIVSGIAEGGGVPKLLALAQESEVYFPSCRAGQAFVFIHAAWERDTLVSPVLWVFKHGQADHREFLYAPVTTFKAGGSDASNPTTAEIFAAIKSSSNLEFLYLPFGDNLDQVRLVLTIFVLKTESP